MTSFWSWYVTLLSLGTIAALVWLLLATRKGQRPDSTEETVGHSYDGIEEYDNPLPRWWFMLFVGTVVFALGSGALPGLGTGKACCRAMRTAGLRSRNGSARWTRPTSSTARCTPNTPPCR